MHRLIAENLLQLAGRGATVTVLQLEAPLLQYLPQNRRPWTLTGCLAMDGEVCEGHCSCTFGPFVFASYGERRVETATVQQ